MTGFAGRVDAAGLSEFATRAYDPVARVWLQEDSYPGSVTRASSMNRYAYVEGAPETFTDFMGAWRAANAARLEELTAVEYATFMMELSLMLTGWEAQFQSVNSAENARFGALQGAKTGTSDTRNWWDKTTDWVVDHKADIVGAVVGTVVGVAVGAACLAATAGTGSVGCLVLAGAAGGAVGGAVTGGMQYVEDTPADQRTVGGFLLQTGTSAAIGGVFGAAAGAAGPLVGAVGSRFASSVAGTAVRSALRPATSAVSGAPRTAGASERSVTSTAATQVRTATSTVATQVRTATSTATAAIRNTADDIGARLRSVNLRDDTGSINLGARPGLNGDEVASVTEAVPGPNNALRDPATGRFVQNPDSARSRTAPRTIVIGEDMEGRVIPYAKEIGADWYQPREAPPSQWMGNNRDWINARMDEGCTIVDCGAAPGRANYPNPTSPYYDMELGEISSRGYPNYVRVDPERSG